MFHADFTTLVNLDYLRFRSFPFVVYLTDTSSLEGAFIPALISTGFFLKYARQIKERKIVIGFLLFTWIIGLVTQYFGATGLHIFTGGLVVWPVLTLLLGDRFPWPMVYPLAFVGTLIPDMYGAGMLNGWSDNWFYGIGGAGFHDGLFLMPLETLLVAILLNQAGIFLRKRGHFIDTTQNHH